MGKIGRNEPCPCGSGKKYKKCCIDKETIEEKINIFKPMHKIEILIDQGEGYVARKMPKEACLKWDEAWEKLKEEITQDIKSINDLERKLKFDVSLFNWCQDYEMELGNAGVEDSSYYEKRIKYCGEFVSLLPNSDKHIIENMRRAEAESYFAVGQTDKGEKTFKKLVKDFPESAWVYIGWGDMYCLYRMHKDNPVDFEKAEKIYREALVFAKEERKDILERLEDLEIEKKKHESQRPNGV